jgi:hypothetical protein
VILVICPLIGRNKDHRQDLVRIVGLGVEADTTVTPCPLFDGESTAESGKGGGARGV